jgi:hypothetical protein
MTAVGLLAAATLAACGGEREPADRIAAPSVPAELDEAEQPGALAISPVTIDVSTYEGSGQIVHPDVAFFPQRWQGRRYWYAATPYPGGDVRHENPSVFNGYTSREMRVPAGASNPIAHPEARSYLSDPDIVLDPDRGELRMFYRQTRPNGDQLFLATSRSGAAWTAGREVLGGPRYALISPAVVREPDGAWRMWTVNASVAGCLSTSADVVLQQRRSADGVRWGTPAPVDLTLSGQVPWHWDVQYVRAKSEYWAMVAAYPNGTSCAQTALYFARSVDGTTWTVSPAPLLRAGEFAPIRDLVYRSTFRYHEGSDAVSVWFSGARLEGERFHYGVALARYPMADLLRRVSGGIAATTDLGAAERPPRELTVAREAFIADFP